jgi:ectoine hydroxylase-related dioxygenase (phytanoyl-CoA dioxygenase family)
MSNVAADGERVAAEIEAKGYHVVEGMLSAERCRQLSTRLEELSARFMPLYARSANTVAVHGEADVRLVYNLHNKGPEFLELVFNELVIDEARRLLSAGSYQSREPFQLALSQARGLYGPHPPQQLHIDSYIPGLPRILVLQAGWALSDFRKGQGATCFVDGSQHTGSFPENGKPYPAFEVEAPAGSLILFHGGMWHGSSAKANEEPRWGIFNRYSRWFMRPSFDHTECTPDALYASLTDEQREILGFRYGAPRDEFTRVTRMSPEPEPPSGYELPKT